MALQSPSGLCPECAATADTVDPTSRVVLPRSESQTPTASAARGATGATATFSAHAAGETASIPRVPHVRPNPPAGYELLEELGHGGMGLVYLARELASGRRVAMKFVRYPGHPDSIARFTTELQVLAALEHPNIVRFMFPDLLRAEPYFLMEYLPGGSLSKRLKDHGPLSLKDAVALIRTIADAVAFAHTHQVIHRDLKPSNVLFATDGTPKVADFGLAKRLDELDPITLASGALGTPGYMPPEQISRKNGEIGPWSDVYGLGATLYHVLVGQSPFTGESREEIIHQVLADPPPRLRAIQPEIPAALEGIVLKCLEKDPKDRYQTVAELVADLDRFTAGQRPVAPSLTYWRRTKRWTKRNRIAVCVGIVISLLLVLVIALSTQRSPTSPTHRDTVAEYQTNLKAGNRVVLVSGKGKPLWSEQPIGGIDLSTPVAAEGACVLNSVQSGSLILLPQTGIDRYTVEAEFSQQQVAGPVPQDAHQWCGLLVGYDLANDPSGGRLHTFFAVTFRDFPFGDGRHEHAICHAAAIVELPGQNPDPVLGNGKYRISFDTSLGLPGPWRKVKFNVAPDRIEAFWWKEAVGEDTKPEWVKFADLGPEQIRERIATTQRTLTLNAPKLTLHFPEWSPRRGIAIWCARSSFAVRNVVVTPSVPTP